MSELLQGFHEILQFPDEVVRDSLLYQYTNPISSIDRALLNTRIEQGAAVDGRGLTRIPILEWWRVLKLEKERAHALHLPLPEIGNPDVYCGINVRQVLGITHRLNSPLFFTSLFSQNSNASAYLETHPFLGGTVLDLAQHTVTNNEKFFGTNLDAIGLLAVFGRDAMMKVFDKSILDIVPQFKKESIDKWRHGVVQKSVEEGVVSFDLNQPAENPEEVLSRMTWIMRHNHEALQHSDWFTIEHTQFEQAIWGQSPVGHCIAQKFTQQLFPIAAEVISDSVIHQKLLEQIGGNGEG